MKPPCHNRPPFAEGRWHYTGEWRRNKPVMRWYPRWFVDRCATHDGAGIGPNNENYPAAHGWDCSGCRLEPNRVAHAFKDIDIVECASIPADMIAVVKTHSVGKSERNVQFFHLSGDMNFLPDDGRRFKVVEIDAFEPIQRSIQRERI